MALAYRRAVCRYSLYDLIFWFISICGVVVRGHVLQVGIQIECLQSARVTPGYGVGKSQRKPLGIYSSCQQ
jgi:hypothetical protein